MFKNSIIRVGAIACLALSLLLSACASRGTDFDPQLVDQLKPKVTKLEEAIQLLGKPNMVSKQADGTKVAQWMHVSVKMGSSASKTVMVSFDKNDVMVKLLQQSQGNN